MFNINLSDDWIQTSDCRNQPLWHWAPTTPLAYFYILISRTKNSLCVCMSYLVSSTYSSLSLSLFLSLFLSLSLSNSIPLSFYQSIFTTLLVRFPILIHRLILKESKFIWRHPKKLICQNFIQKFSHGGGNVAKWPFLNSFFEKRFQRKFQQESISAINHDGPIIKRRFKSISRFVQSGRCITIPTIPKLKSWAPWHRNWSAKP